MQPPPPTPATVVAAPITAKPPRRRTLWRWLLRSIVGLLLTIIIAIAWFGGTTTGTRQVVNWVTQSFIPNLSYSSVEGRLLGQLTVHDVQYQSPQNTRIAIKFLDFSWQPIALLDKTISITTIQVDQADIQLADSPPANTPTQSSTFNWRDYALPVTIDIQDILLTHITLTTAATAVAQPNADWHIAHFQTALRIDPQAIQLQSVTLDASTTRAPYPLQLQLQMPHTSLDWSRNTPKLSSLSTWQLQGLPNGALTGTATITGDLSANNQVDIQTQGIADSQLKLQIQLQPLIWQLTARTRISHLSTLHPSASSLPLTLTLEAQGGDASAALKLSQLTLQSQDARLRLTGEIGATANQLLDRSIELDYTITIPYLARLIPAIKGAIKGSGQVSGHLQRPNMHHNLALNKLRIGHTQLETITLKSTLNWDKPSSLQLVGKQLAINNQPASDLSITATGNPTQHDAIINLSNHWLKTRLHLQGSLDQKQLSWLGQISQWDILNTPLGNWRLKQATALSLDPKHLQLARLCWHSAPAQLCTQATWQNGITQAQLALTQLDTARLSAWLPQSVQINTALSADIKGEWQDQQAFSATAKLNLAAGSAQIALPEKEITLPISQSQLNITAQAEQIESTLSLKMGDLAEVKGKLDLKKPFTKRQLLGDFSAQVHRLDDLTFISPEIEHLTGRLEAQLALTGNITEPQLRGHIALKQGAFNIPKLNTTFKAAELNARFADRQKQVQLTGQIASEQGTLELSGYFTLVKPRLQLDIVGEQFLIANTAQAKLALSPQLRLQIADKEMDIKGNIHIPEAFYKQQSGSNQRPIIHASPDVQIIQQHATAPSTAPALQTNLLISLGEQVKLSIADLTAQLTGQIRLEQAAKQPLRAAGAIQIAKGDYVLYGQKLQIDRGRILFGGGLITKPGLDMQASRQFKQTDNSTTQVGVRVTGALDQPVLTLFSSPHMPDSSIVSYLILGRAPDARSGAESAMLLSAVQGMALRRSGADNTLGKIGKQIGLDTLGLSQTDGAASTSFNIGKYITPQLYVGYGVGLFDQLSFFTLRYQFLKWLRLEGKMGQDNSNVDILYTREQ